MSERIIFILLGPPGSGKGTQAVKLSQALKIPHISTGNILREQLALETALGKQAKEFMESGRLVPDELVLDMLKSRMQADDCQGGVLLDGFPRTLVQAEAFDRLLQKGDRLLVANLDVDDDVIVKRAAGRLSCRQCGSVFHAQFSPPQKSGICDYCQGELYQRPDDAPEVVTKRLAVYHTQTKPLIDYYDTKGVLTTVDGEASPQEVFTALDTLYSSSLA